jgi:hypothetical protein
MTISNISSSDYYSSLQALSANSPFSRSAGSANPLSDALDSLQSALSSGDTSTAQKVLSQIVARAPRADDASGSGDTDSGGSTSSNPGAKIGSFLKQVQSALSSGDTSKAQSVISSLQDYMAANPPPQPPGGKSDGVSAPTNPLDTALTSLEDALSSNDTSSAQKILSDLLAHAPKSADSGTDSTNAANSSSSTDNISDFLKQLQSAMSSGETSKAEDLLSSLKDYLQKNPPPPPPGAGTYSTDGGFTSSYSAANRALNSIA